MAAQNTVTLFGETTYRVTPINNEHFTSASPYTYPTLSEVRRVIMLLWKEWVKEEETRYMILQDTFLLSSLLSYFERRGKNFLKALFSDITFEHFLYTAQTFEPKVINALMVYGDPEKLRKAFAQSETLLQHHHILKLLGPIDEYKSLPSTLLPHLISYCPAPVQHYLVPLYLAFMQKNFLLRKNLSLNYCSYVKK